MLAFEPVPHFYAFLEYSVHLNGLVPLVDMRKNVVSHESGKTMEMVVPSRGIWGTAGIGGLNIDIAIEGSEFYLQLRLRTQHVNQHVLQIQPTHTHTHQLLPQHTHQLQQNC